MGWSMGLVGGVVPGVGDVVARAGATDVCIRVIQKNRIGYKICSRLGLSKLVWPFVFLAAVEAEWDCV